jgi:hypothetical protein
MWARGNKLVAIKSKNNLFVAADHRSSLILRGTGKSLKQGLLGCIYLMFPLTPTVVKVIGSHSSWTHGIVVNGSATGQTHQLTNATL